MGLYCCFLPMNGHSLISANIIGIKLYSTVILILTFKITKHCFKCFLIIWCWFSINCLHLCFAQFPVRSNAFFLSVCESSMANMELPDSDPASVNDSVPSCEEYGSLTTFSYLLIQGPSLNFWTKITFFLGQPIANEWARHW